MLTPRTLYKLVLTIWVAILAWFFRFGFSALVVLVECDWLGSLGELGRVLRCAGT